MDNSGNSTNIPNQPQNPAGAPPVPPTPGTAPRPMAGAPTPGAPAPGAVPPTSGVSQPAGPVPTPGAPAPGATTGPAPGAPAPNAAAPGATKPATPDAKKKKITYIILGCVAAVLVIACIVVAVIMMTSQNSKPVPTNPTPVATDPEPQAKTPIEDMNADEMIAAFDEMQEDNYTLEDYLPEIVQSYAYGHIFSLTDSYTDVDELQDYELYNGEYDLNVEVSEDDTFAVITALDGDEIAVNTPVYIAFNNEYLEYATPTSAVGIGGSEVPGLTIVDSSEEFLNVALPLLNISVGNMPLNMTYDFKIDVDDTEAILTTYLIGIGTNTSGSTASTSTVDSNDEEAIEGEEVIESDYAIQGAESQLVLDIESGEVSFTDYNGARQDLLVSFPIAEEDFIDRYQLMVRAAGYSMVYPADEE